MIQNSRVTYQRIDEDIRSRDIIEIIIALKCVNNKFDFEREMFLRETSLINRVHTKDDAVDKRLINTYSTFADVLYVLFPVLK